MSDHNQQWKEVSADLYEVFNTSHRSILVLAKDRQAALSLAWTACHIRFTDSGLESEGRGAHKVTLRPTSGDLAENWSALQKAASQKLQGVVNFKGDKIQIGNRVIEL